MALETLKNVEKIDGFGVIDLDTARLDPAFFDADAKFDWEKFDKHRENFPVSICHSQNMISFKIQKGPIKEVGANGCQVDTIIAAALRIVEGLNENYPCDENKEVISFLAAALTTLENRRLNIERRGVEGFAVA